MKEDLDRFLPLSTAALHILLSSAGEERHGGIMQEIARQSDGRYKLGPGTLYDNLQRLVTERLVEETENSATGAESRRRYYRLTKVGRRVLSMEIARLEEAIREAKLHLGFQRGTIRSVLLIVASFACIRLHSKSGLQKKCYGSSI